MDERLRVPRLRAPWHPWEAIPVAVGALVTALAASVIFTAALGGPGGSALLLTAIAFQAALATATLVWVAVRYRGWTPALGLRSARTARDVAFGAWTGAALFAAAAFAVLPILQLAWTLVTGEPPPPINQPILPVDPTPVQVALGTLAVVLGAPFGEEVFFRGFLFGSLRSRFSFLPAATMSAAVFALFHVQPLLILVMVFVGVGLAYLYERRGSLAASIAAHGMFNLIGFTVILMNRL
jgi:membrane protease YdiL (CAAX protease family)